VQNKNKELGKEWQALKEKDGKDGFDFKEFENEQILEYLERESKKPNQASLRRIRKSVQDVGKNVTTMVGSLKLFTLHAKCHTLLGRERPSFSRPSWTLFLL
jgi:hypothetical protein